MPRKAGRIDGRKALGLDEPDRPVRQQPGMEDYDEDEKGPEQQQWPQTTQEKIVATRGDIEDTNENTVGMLDDAINVGAKTNEKLRCQGEQMNRARQDLDDVQENVEYANKHLSRMEMCCCIAIIYSCCCCCCHESQDKPVRKIKNYDDEKRTKERGEDRDAIHEKMDTVSKAKRNLIRVQAQSHEDDAAKHETVFDAQLDVMGGQLGILNELAKDQAKELEYQKKHVIKNLDGAVVQRKAEIRQANRRAQGLLR